MFYDSYYSFNYGIRYFLKKDISLEITEKRLMSKSWNKEQKFEFENFRWRIP